MLWTTAQGRKGASFPRLQNGKQNVLQKITAREVPLLVLTERKDS